MASGTYFLFVKNDTMKYKYSHDNPKGDNSVDIIADWDK